MIRFLVAALLVSSPTFAADPPATTVEVPMIAADALGALLKEAPGRVRVVNFWATWCGPCVAELPTIRDWAAAHPDVEVVLINVDSKSQHDRKVVPFVKQHALGAPRNVHLDDIDPAMALARVVPEWPDAIPVTSVHRADGTRSALFTEAVTAAQLDAAVAAAAR